MNNVGKTANRIVAAALLLASLASCTLLGLQGGQDESEITRAVDCYAASWSRRDMDSLGRCFTSDADFVSVTGAWWQGRDAIQKNHGFLLGTADVTTRGITLPVQAYGLLKNSLFAFTSTHVRSVRGDVSVVHATWRITEDVRTSKPRIGLMTMLLTRDAGVWRIASLQDMETHRSIR